MIAYVRAAYTTQEKMECIMRAFHYEEDRIVYFYHITARCMKRIYDLNIDKLIGVVNDPDYILIEIINEEVGGKANDQSEQDG